MNHHFDSPFFICINIQFLVKINEIIIILSLKITEMISIIVYSRINDGESKVHIFKPPHIMVLQF